MRLTGPVPIQDEEFATLKENADLNAAVSLAFLIGILWLALRSARIIVAVLISIFVGLSITAAFGFLVVGSLNPISIAFAVLFVGIGVDFGIQFSVRYRAERYEVNNLRVALKRGRAARRHSAHACGGRDRGGLPVVPADRLPAALSELGQIAGVGMIIAFLVSITLLPALLALFNPPGEMEPLGYSSLAPVDRFMERHRIAIIVGTAVVSLGGLPLLYYLQFDFNPMNLRSPKVELIATYLDLRRDPTAGVKLGRRGHALARGGHAQVAERLARCRKSSSVLTLELFIPADQAQKLAAIARGREGTRAFVQRAAARSADRRGQHRSA